MIAFFQLKVHFYQKLSIVCLLRSDVTRRPFVNVKDVPLMTLRGGNLSFFMERLFCLLVKVLCSSIVYVFDRAFDSHH